MPKNPKSKFAIVAKNATRDQRVGNTRRFKENCNGNRNSQRKMSTLLTLRRKKAPAKIERSPSGGRTLITHREKPWPTVTPGPGTGTGTGTGGKSGKHFLLITAQQKKK